jgi:hypothetical protein
MLMFRSVGAKAKIADELYNLKIEGTSEDIITILEQISDYSWEENRLLALCDKKEIKMGKFAPYLPKELLQKMQASQFLDINGALSTLREMQWFKVEYEEEETID